MSGHTPGPWSIVFSGTQITPSAIRGVAPDHKYVCEIKCPHSCGERHLNDARLIAAAPEMLEAAKAVMDSLIRGEISWISTMGESNLDDLKLAIAKAEGRQ